MRPKEPIVFEGKEYNEYAVQLASAPIIREGDYTTGVNLTLIPMRVNEEGKIELLQEQQRTVLFSDIVTQGDPDALLAFGTINAAIQTFIDKKNI